MLDWLVPHQTNKRIIDATTNRMNLEESKVLMNIENGNTTFCDLTFGINEDICSKGRQCYFAAFGGFTWGSIYLKWAYDKNKLN
jgi:3-oxoacyl-[acyl-carrier-protein] synthase-3